MVGGPNPETGDPYPTLDPYDAATKIWRIDVIDFNSLARKYFENDFVGADGLKLILRIGKVPQCSYSIVSKEPLAQ